MYKYLSFYLVLCFSSSGQSWHPWVLLADTAWFILFSVCMLFKKNICFPCLVAVTSQYDVKHVWYKQICWSQREQKSQRKESVLHHCEISRLILCLFVLPITGRTVVALNRYCGYLFWLALLLVHIDLQWHLFFFWIKNHHLWELGHFRGWSFYHNPLNIIPGDILA